MMKFHLILILGFSLIEFVLVGCISTSETWKRNSTTADQFATDESLCRIHASEKAEDNYRDRIGYSSASGINKDTQYNTLMNQYDLRRNFQKTFETCLVRRGYKKHNSD